MWNYMCIRWLINWSDSTKMHGATIRSILYVLWTFKICVHKVHRCTVHFVKSLQLLTNKCTKCCGSMLPQHLVYKNELNHEYVITLARNDETPWWWSERIETCLNVYALLFPSLQLKLKRRFHISNNYLYRGKKWQFWRGWKFSKKRFVNSFKGLFRKIPEVIEENQGSRPQSREWKPPLSRIWNCRDNNLISDIMSTKARLNTMSTER